MNLDAWAQRWGVPAEAIDDLRAEFGTAKTTSDSTAANAQDSEARVQSEIRLEGAQQNIRLMRNNVGAMYDANGQFIRFGLANESKKMNSVIKSSDLIGIKPVLITEEMVGHTIGQFVARECKKRAWQYRGTKEEAAQLAFLELIVSLGGDATFANDVGTL